MVLGLGFGSGLVATGAMWLSIFKERFFKVLKLMMAIFFLVHVTIYFAVEPRFNPEYVMYWFVFAVFTGMVLVAFAMERSRRAAGFFERFHHKTGWSAKAKNYLLSKQESGCRGRLQMQMRRTVWSRKVECSMGKLER